MPFVITDTLARGVMAAIVTGTLAQWRDAVKAGTTANAEHNIRECFNQILAVFDKLGLKSVWNDFTARPVKDGTFLLEDKRK
jgi:hypothetical protein